MCSLALLCERDRSWNLKIIRGLFNQAAGAIFQDAELDQSRFRRDARVRHETALKSGRNNYHSLTDFVQWCGLRLHLSIR